jgi:hypothetical protein
MMPPPAFFTVAIELETMKAPIAAPAIAIISCGNACAMISNLPPEITKLPKTQPRMMRKPTPFSMTMPHFFLWCFQNYRTDWRAALRCGAFLLRRPMQFPLKIRPASVDA